MFGEKHDLLSELPEFRDQIHHLKMNDNHFAKLFAEYHDVEHEVHRIEEGVENTSDDYLDGKKKHRLHLKDSLVRIIQDFNNAPA